MENKNESGNFRYTYSAREQAELRQIREKYTGGSAEGESKLARLRRLDASVTQKAQAISLIFGVIGTLILGFGMSLILSTLGEALGLGFSMRIVLGIVIGAVGGTLAGLAYPVYHFVLEREKKRVAPEILQLTEELMQ